MKTLVIYFSHSGNNRLLAEHLARRLGCDICPIVEKKRRTGLTMLLDMMFRREPRIEPLPLLIADYDQTILVAPVWASRVASPMKSLVKREKNSLAHYSFITLCGYERPEQKERITNELTTLIGRSPHAVAELRLSNLFPVEKRHDVRTISRYHATADDLAFFEPELAAFLVSDNLIRASNGTAVSAHKVS